VTVAHGAQTLSGELVGEFEHPLYGACADVLVDGQCSPRRFSANRVIALANPTKKSRRFQKASAPSLDPLRGGTHA